MCGAGGDELKESDPPKGTHLKEFVLERLFSSDSQEQALVSKHNLKFICDYLIWLSCWEIMK